MTHHYRVVEQPTTSLENLQEVHYCQLPSIKVSLEVSGRVLQVKKYRHIKEEITKHEDPSNLPRKEDYEYRQNESTSEENKMGDDAKIIFRNVSNHDH